MKIKANTANAKRAHIQTLLYLGLKPGLRVLETDVPATEAREREAHWIQEHRSPYLLNSTDGGEGVRETPVTVYGLCDPRNGQIFYLGIAANPVLGFKQHLKDALTINAVIDPAERHRLPWSVEERELVYSGADIEIIARALGRTIAAARSHLSLSISSAGFASAFVTDALQAAYNLHKVGKLECRPAVTFYSDEPGSYARGLPPELLAFAKSLAIHRSSMTYRLL
jgi:hypothetical protein